MTTVDVAFLREMFRRLSASPSVGAQRALAHLVAAYGHLLAKEMN